MKAVFYDFNHKRAKRIGETIGFILGILLLFKMIPALDAMDHPQAASAPAPAAVETTTPTPEPAADVPAIDAQAPTAAGKDVILPVDGIDGNTVLTLGDDVYYEFGDHGYMSVGLDGTALPFDVYYGIGVSIHGSQFDLTWHNYADADVTPTTVTMYSPYRDKYLPLGDLTVAEGQPLTISAANAETGPYEVQVSWSSGAVTTIGLYKNGGDLYTCQAAEKSSTYMCYWYDRKDAIDRLLAAAGVTPENSLDYGDDRWAYPVPADYGSKYRCDNSRWISLAQELAGDASLPDAQKAILIHDWMVENLAYDEYKVTHLGNTRAAVHKDYTGKYSMWDTKTGVCADFTTVYCIMLRSLGIPAVSLDYNDEHVWNVVYLDGDWVEIDLTDDIDRMVYSEDVTDIENADDTVDYDAFGTPYTTETITGKYHINRGVYTYNYVTGKGWD